MKSCFGSFPHFPAELNGEMPGMRDCESAANSSSILLPFCIAPCQTTQTSSPSAKHGLAPCPGNTLQRLRGEMGWAGQPLEASRSHSLPKHSSSDFSHTLDTLNNPWKLGLENPIFHWTVNLLCTVCLCSFILVGLTRCQPMLKNNLIVRVCVSFSEEGHTLCNSQKDKEVLAEVTRNQRTSIKVKDTSCGWVSWLPDWLTISLKAACTKLCSIFY